MYLVFRCNCGRANYAREGVKQKKCVCGKTLKIKDRKILKNAQDAESAAQIVRELQEEKYGGMIFTTANKLR
jgi:hypothetical protein